MNTFYFSKTKRKNFFFKVIYKNSLTLLLLFTSLSLFSQVRKDLNSLSPAARKELVDLMQEYITKQIIEDHCSATSNNNTMNIHDDLNFLPFHRAYIEGMEDFLMKKGYPQYVPLPSWNPNTATPAELRVIDPDCAATNATCHLSCTLPTNWDPKIPRPGYLTLPTRSGTYDDLCDFLPPSNHKASITEVLEGEGGNVVGSNYHNSVHSTMRGTMGNFASPSVPIFWNFHSFIDDIWKEYECSCPNRGRQQDLYMKDNSRIVAATRDIGAEPNTDPGSIAISEDIWVRNQNDGKVNYTNQNPIYSTLNYVYVRVRNRGCQTSSGNEKLILQWSKGATDQTWPSYWDGSITSPAIMGDTIFEVTIPAIVAGGSTILEIQWFPPNSANYSSNTTPKSFSLLARIVGSNDPMTFAEVANVQTNVRNNNNIVMKNVTVDSPPNVFPLVSITDPGNNAQYIAPASVIIKANASDDDGSISKVEFYNGTTLIGTGTGSPYTFTWTNVQAGDYTITAKATDNLNGTTTSSAVNIKVKNNALPVVNISSPVDGSVYIDPANISITATATDADGGISKVEFYNGTVLLGSASTSPYTYNWANVQAGTYALTAKAYDDLNATKTSTAVHITVNNNSLPSVQITEPTDGTQLIAPATTTVKAVASDTDGSISKIEFYNGTSLLGTATSSPYTLSLTNLQTGIFKLSAKAYDDLNGSTTSDTVILTVKANMAPVVTLTSPSTGAVFISPATVTIQATASDSDGNITKVEFYNGLNLLGSASDAPYSFSWTNVLPGSYAITAKAYDNLNAVTTSTSATITVNNNSLPTVSITEPVNGTILLASTSTTLKATASDSDGNITKVEFYDGTTLLGSSTTIPYQLPLNNLQAGIYKLTAKAYDDLDATSVSAEVTLTVNNNIAPAIQITAPADGLVLISPAAVTLKAIATDSDGSISKVEFYNGTTLLASLTTVPYTYDWNNIAVGTHTITAKAFDDLNAVTTSSSITIKVNENKVPEVSITAPSSGTTLIAPANITIVANAIDNDGTITKVEFYNGSILIGTDASSPYSFDWNAVLKGNYTLTAKAYDNSGATKTSAEVTVTVHDNNAPTVQITSPTSGTIAIAPANFTITATANDSDGSIVKVEFYNGTTLIGSDATSPYSVNWNSILKGNYTLTAKAYDDLGASTVSTDILITINDNVAPTVQITLPVNGTTAIAPANFTIKATASDSDGSINKVEFYNGAILIETDVTSPYSIDWTAVPKGTYTLTAKAYDDLGATKTSTEISVTVNDNSIPTVQITSPADGTVVTEPANFTLKATANDSDGSITKVEFYNGITLIGTSSTSPYSFNWNNVPAGNYSLTAKAYDDLNATGNSAVISVVVQSNNLPVVQITSPSDGASYISPANYTITADANDSDGNITKVEFYDGTTLLASDDSSPYSLDISNIGAGTYTYTVKAFDNLNASTLSAQVNVIVTGNQLPVTQINFPANNETFISPANITISASAVDNDGSISKVEFYEGTNLIGTDQTSPYTADWLNVATGTYNLTVKAFDNTNAFSISSQIKVTVTDNSLPLVIISSPLNNSTIISPATVSIKANASDADGTISKVEFYEGTTLLAADNSTPYEYSWNNIPLGNYKIIAKAYDNINAFSYSDTVKFEVISNIPPTVSIADPLSGATFITPANTIIKAIANDSDGSISKVEFYEGNNLLGTSTSSPYTFEWKNIATGSYNLTAKAYDNHNVSTTSATVSITVKDNSLPSVSISDPVNGTNAISPANFTVKAIATDSDGSISKVEFYEGSTLLKTLTGSPYIFDWNAVLKGNYTLTAKAYDDLGAATTSAGITVTVNDNVAPTVHISSPANNSIGISPASLSIKVNATDSDGNISKVEFYEGTNLLGSKTSSPYTYNWNNITTGTYSITAKAYDNYNLSTTSTPITIIIKENSLPTVVITNPANGETAIAPANFTIKSNASDSDGNITKVEFYEGTTLKGTATTSPFNYNWSNVPVGTYTLTAKAYDELNAVTTSAPVTVTVKENNLPTVTITNPAAGTTGIAPADFVIKANASDSDGNISKVEFYEGTTLLGTSTTSPYSYIWKNIPTGTYKVTAKATDNLNASVVSPEVTLIVKDNVPPIVSISNPSNGVTVIAPANFSIKANANDTDGSISKVEFYEGSNLLGVATTSPYTFEWTYVTAGNYLLTAKAYDNLNAVTVSSSISVTVKENSLPTVNISSPFNGTSAIAPANFTITANASDSDGNISKVEFYNGTNLIASKTSPPYTYDWKGILAGTYTITAKAYDNLNAFTVSSEVTITVKDNVLPIVSITTPVNGTTAIAPADFTIKVNASDSDGSITKVEFYEGTKLLGEDRDNPYTFDISSLSPGVYIYTAKAYDDLSATTTSSEVKVTVNQNSIPVVTIISPIDGSTHIAPALIVLTANASDNDGSISKVEFYEGTNLIGVAMNSPYTYNWNAVSTGSYTVTAKVYDDLNASSVSSQVKLTVKDNKAPIVNITAPATNTTILVSNSITIKANASDTDGSIVKVEFYEGNNLLGTSVSSPYTFDWSKTQTGTYTFTAKAYDNLNATKVSDLIKINVVDNFLPTVKIVAPANDTSFVLTDPINITATAADSMGSISKVEFYSNGNLIGSAINSPYTFTWTNVPLGTYSIIAKAYDNQNANSLSDTLLIKVEENKKPMVMIMSPFPLAQFKLNEDILISSHFHDDDGFVTKLEFYQNNILIGTSISSPFQFVWKNAPVGTYELTVVAFDNLGASDKSPSVTISIVEDILPTIRIANPANGDIFSSNSDITLTADVGNAGTHINWVNFYYNTILIGSDSTEPYTFNWEKVAVGSYKIIAEANYDANEVIVTDEVNITVVNNQAPAVSITSPAEEDEFITGTDIHITADATDDGSIQRVEFYRGTILIATDSTSPYGCDWKKAAEGTYLLTAKAYDNLGIVTISKAVTVHVGNNVPPMVLLLSPSNNDVFTGPTDIEIAVHAHDDDGSIQRIDFYNGSVLLGSDSTEPYTYNWKNVGIGTYAISAIAYDNLQAYSISTVSTIKVQANQLPVVVITSPKEGSTYDAPATVTMEAIAYDPNGSIVKVDFYRGNVLIETDSTSPYSCTWTNVSKGTYVLTAKAYDNLNAMTISPEVTIVVNDVSTSIDSYSENLTNLVIYPVPFDSRVSLKLSSTKTIQSIIRIYNETGKEVISFNREIGTGEQLIDIDTEHLPNGIYFITLQTGDQLMKKKILKINSH